VIRKTGKPFSMQRVDWRREAAAERSAHGPLFGLLRKPADLCRRIDARVDEMFERGLVEETRRLLDLGLARNRTAMQAIGYHQVAEFLQGQRSLPETIELVKARTRQFAKRQMTWFRHQFKVEWFDLPETEAPEQTASRLADQIERSHSLP
jgi:tRNA dimethylallyltransferase